MWGVRWNETVAGSRDFQPCPMGGVLTETYGNARCYSRCMHACHHNKCCVTGFVLRLCNMDGEWNNTIDIANCSSANFIDLERMAVSA